jgi:hypothetical protein
LLALAYPALPLSTTNAPALKRNIDHQTEKVRQPNFSHAVAALLLSTQQDKWRGSVGRFSDLEMPNLQTPETPSCSS